MATVLGVAKNRVWGYEKGNTLPDVDYMASFCKATGADFAQLLQMRMEAAGHEPGALFSGISDEAEAYTIPVSLAFLRSRLQVSVMPSEWAMFLVELTARGKISTAAADEIADFWDSWEPSQDWLDRYDSTISRD